MPLQELASARACALWDHEAPRVTDFVGSIVTGANGESMMTLTLDKVVNNCIQQLMDGEVDVVLGYEVPVPVP